jgi:hypothetical protein
LYLQYLPRRLRGHKLFGDGPTTTFHQLFQRDIGGCQMKLVTAAYAANLLLIFFGDAIIADIVACYFVPIAAIISSIFLTMKSSHRLGIAILLIVAAIRAQSK